MIYKTLQRKLKIDQPKIGIKFSSRKVRSSCSTGGTRRVPVKQHGHVTIQHRYIWIKNEHSRETGNIGYTRRKRTKQKHNTICAEYHFAQAKTNNVNKT